MSKMFVPLHETKLDSEWECGIVLGSTFLFPPFVSATLTVYPVRALVRTIFKVSAETSRNPFWAIGETHVEC